MEDSHQEYGHLCSYADNLVVFHVVEEPVEEQEEHLPGVRYWDLPETVKDRIDQILQVEPPATQGTWATLVSM